MLRTLKEQPKPPLPKKVVRCAIYTRKSTDDGLEQEFNSLDAQREAAAAFIASQKSEGWTCLPEFYDDGGYSGGNADRPALQRLLADVTAAKIDLVAVYKLDRLSRSIRDFHKIMEIFEAHGVAFVSVTQQFNTATSMGRLTLNMLLSFAQFEREMISERTRDKIAATRRKGMWSGGMPVLGYDVSEQGKLVINPAEAVIVRSIFELYIQHQSLIAVLKELEARGWHTKQWTTRKETVRGGKPFAKDTLYHLLRNVVYVGHVRYKDEIHPGEQEAIVAERLWQRVQALLSRNRKSGASATRNKYGALLRGLLHCKCCECAMVPAYTSKGTKRYRYYVCLQAQKKGWHTCPSKSVPAGQIEKFVVDQIRRIGSDPTLVSETLRQAQHQIDEQVERLTGQATILEKALKTCLTQMNRIVARSAGAHALAELQGKVQDAEAQLAKVHQEKTRRQQEVIDQGQLTEALAKFDPVWEALTPREQARLLELLIARIDYDGSGGEVRITFHPTGIRSLAAGTSIQTQEIAA